MPTHEEDDRFLAQYRALTPQQRAAFKRALPKFIHDVATERFRKGLRVKPFRGIPGFWEMTWAADGRAVFRYGEPIRPGERHVVWLRIGTHDIFDES